MSGGLGHDALPNCMMRTPAIGRTAPAMRKKSAGRAALPQKAVFIQDERCGRLPGDNVGMEGRGAKAWD